MNTEVLNRLLKKLKNCYTYSALLCFFWIPVGTATEDIPPPPEQGEKTKASSNKETAPPALPKEQPSTNNKAAPVSVMQTTEPALPKDQGPESDDSRNIPQPEVNIIHRKDTTIEEYRINGRIRYVKIIPKIGKPYYLVDKDGDGELETRHSDLDGVPPVNEWILLQW